MKVALGLARSIQGNAYGLPSSGQSCAWPGNRSRWRNISCGAAQVGVDRDLGCAWIGDVKSSGTCSIHHDLIRRAEAGVAPHDLRRGSGICSDCSSAVVNGNAFCGAIAYNQSPSAIDLDTYRRAQVSAGSLKGTARSDRSGSQGARVVINVNCVPYLIGDIQPVIGAIDKNGRNCKARGICAGWRQASGSRGSRCENFNLRIVGYVEQVPGFIHRYISRRKKRGSGPGNHALRSNVPALGADVIENKNGKIAVIGHVESISGCVQENICRRSELSIGSGNRDCGRDISTGRQRLVKANNRVSPGIGYVELALGGRGAWRRSWCG